MLTKLISNLKAIIHALDRGINQSNSNETVSDNDKRDPGTYDLVHLTVRKIRYL